MLFLLQMVQICLDLHKVKVSIGCLLSLNCIYQTPSRKDSLSVSSVSYILDGVPQPED